MKKKQPQKEPRERAQELTRLIVPPHGSEGESTEAIARALIELLAILTYTEQLDDRATLIFDVGEAAYPLTEKGYGEIDKFIQSAMPN